MINFIKTIIILLSALILLCAATFTNADTITNTNSTVTTSTGNTSGTIVDGNGGVAKTTVSKITTTTTVHDIDASIIAAIYARYAQNATLRGTTLTLTCQNGFVTISGSATMQSQADEAVKIAKSIGGVKDVRSMITVTTNTTTDQSTAQPNY